MPSDDNFREILQEVDDYLICTLDPQGFIQNWNKGGEKIMGYSAAEVIGKTYNIISTPENSQEDFHGKLLLQANRHGKATYEGWIMIKNGVRNWAHVHLTPILKGDKLTSYLLVCRDMTEKRDTLERMRRAEELQNSMVAEIQDYAILSLNPLGLITSWNIGAERIKGYTAPEVIGRHIGIFYTKEDREIDKPSHLIILAKETGRAHDEGWRVRKDGSLFWAGVTITALHDRAGHIIGFTKVTRDLTDKKKTEDALRLYNETLKSKNRELEELTYITSHDLQEPLRTITSLIELLSESFINNKDENVRNSFRFIHDAAARMRQLIKDILDYSRLGRNVSMKYIDTNALLKLVCDDLDLVIQEKGAQIYHGPLPTLKVYESEFKLLFQNLILNAIKFSRKDVPPEILISAEETDNGWQFSITDNGIGIEPSYLEKVFVIFQRLHNRQQYEGSGIGLAHCKKIVELHKGKIWVTSQHGVGSTFYFTINN